MRYLRYAFMASLAILLVTVALANRTLTELRFLPPELADFLGFTWAIELPVFVVFFGGVVLGVVVGFIWEWLREYQFRSQVSRQRRDLRNAEREITKLRGEKYEGQDDVLALLEEPAK